MSNNISPQIQGEFCLQWQEHIEDLSGDGKVTFRELSYLKTLFQKKDIIGHSKDQIRPGEIGKLDVFRALKCLEYFENLSRDARLILADLDETTLENLQKKDEGREKHKRAEKSRKRESSLTCHY